MSYEQWSKVRDQLSIEDFPKELTGIYSVITSFHTNSVEHTDLTSSDLANLVFSQPVKDKTYTEKVIENIVTCDASASTTEQLINALRRSRTLKKISLLSYEIAEGRSNSSSDIDEFTTLIQSLTTGTDSTLNGKATSEDFVTDDLQTLVDSAVTQPGLRWRLNTLNQMLGSLRKGNFGFIFARPETGKTTFLASELTYMAGQLAETAGPILWINNEQAGSEVMLRIYQAALGVDLVTLYSNIDGNVTRYKQITKNKIKVYDSGAIHKNTIEKLCSQYQPSLIAIDQLDAIHGFNADRKDLQLGEIYRWARELAKQYCPIIGVCQADGTGEGMPWLTMANVADAKTAKQAHADWIMGIGKKNDAGYENLRYLHLPKNKLCGDVDSDPNQRHGKREVIIEANIGRYRDI